MHRTLIRYAELCCSTKPLAGIPRTKPRGTGVLLLNMGGPSTTAEVEPFLRNLFQDGDLIPLGRFQKLLGHLIARRRTPKIQRHYEEIGGGSPIRRWSEEQATKACELLDKISPATAPHLPYIAFRYAHPLTSETLERIKSDGIERVVAFSQYPQYSCSTTGSSLNELWRTLNKTGLLTHFKWSVIDRWATHPLLVRTFANKIAQELQKITETERNNALILFSAHSLPMSVVNRGDPYPVEVAATVQAVMAELAFSNPYRLLWQSQVGPAPWLGPQTQKSVHDLHQRGIKHAILVPIAFTSDHIETLHELDIELIQSMNWPGLRRCESLNDDPLFIEAMADVVKSHLESGEKCSHQMTLRCPSCTNTVCQASKEFFAGKPAL